MRCAAAARPAGGSGGEGDRAEGLALGQTKMCSSGATLMDSVCFCGQVIAKLLLSPAKVQANARWRRSCTGLREPRAAAGGASRQPPQLPQSQGSAATTHSIVRARCHAGGCSSTRASAARDQRAGGGWRRQRRRDSAGGGQLGRSVGGRPSHAVTRTRHPPARRQVAGCRRQGKCVPRMTTVEGTASSRGPMVIPLVGRRVGAGGNARKATIMCAAAGRADRDRGSHSGAHSLIKHATELT